MNFIFELKSLNKIKRREDPIKLYKFNFNFYQELFKFYKLVYFVGVTIRFNKLL